MKQENLCLSRDVVSIIVLDYSMLADSSNALILCLCYSVQVIHPHVLFTLSIMFIVKYCKVQLV